MLEIVEGSPAHRRRYLDLALAQVAPGYTAVLSTYCKALTQRNALLKQIAEQGGDPEQLVYWDGEIAGLGGSLIRARIEALLAPRLGRLALLAGEFRERVKASFTELPARRRFWEGVLAGPSAESGYRGEEDAARRASEAGFSEARFAPAGTAGMGVGGTAGRCLWNWAWVPWLWVQ